MNPVGGMYQLVGGSSHRVVGHICDVVVVVNSPE